MQNFSFEITEFDLHENEPVIETHFHMNGFTKKQKATRNGVLNGVGVDRSIFGELNVRLNCP